MGGNQDWVCPDECEEGRKRHESEGTCKVFFFFLEESESASGQSPSSSPEGDVAVRLVRQHLEARVLEGAAHSKYNSNEHRTTGIRSISKNTCVRICAHVHVCLQVHMGLEAGG